MASNPQGFGGFCGNGGLTDWCTELQLANNALTGTLPDCFGVPGSTVQVLDLSNNFFHGTVPGSWSLMTQLVVLTLGFNNLAGPLPPWVGNLSSLASLDMSQNFLTGTVPKYAIWALPMLAVLSYDANCGLVWPSGTTNGRRVPSGDCAGVPENCCNVSVCLTTPQRPASHCVPTVPLAPGAVGVRIAPGNTTVLVTWAPPPLAHAPYARAAADMHSPHARALPTFAYPRARAGTRR